MESGGRGQNGDNPSLPWEMWELNNMYSSATASVTTTGFTLVPETSCSMQPQQQQEGENASTRVVFGHHSDCFYRYDEPPYRQHSLYGSNLHPDPHLMCLKLGKRHYFEDNSSGMSERYLGGGFSLGKRGKPYDIQHMGTVASSSTAASGGSSATLQPRCQVEGCHVALTDAKDYHKRHKVCEMHSKSPMVLVLGLEQRFCQQCSRFHVVSEFDDSKRSCRRRLAGHNERRRKSSQDSIPRNSSQDMSIGARLTHLTSPRGSALSLLSLKNDCWVTPSDLSSRSSAALRELISEHRAAILARQLILERHSNNHHQTTVEGLSLSESSQFNNASCLTTYQGQMVIEPHCWNRFHDSNRQVTLDLMQTPSSAFGLLPSRMKGKEEAEEEEQWNTFE